MAKTIIIIDDDAEVQGVLKDALERKGFIVQLAEDGEKGLALIEKQNVDLILIDILIPKKDGIMTCETLRQDPSKKHIPIILMTGVYRDFDFRVFLQKTLVNDFITKPIKLDELMAKISRLV